LHRGAGAYICGEETGLLESLEGKKGWPRLKPPFPATSGLYGCPTCVNNVETLAAVVPIIQKGGDWYASLGTPKNGGTRLFCVSGHVKKPGTYELPMGIPLRSIIYDYAGGIKDDRKLKAVIPGGSSVPILTADEIDVKMDFDSVAAIGSLLGSGRDERRHLHGESIAAHQQVLCARILRTVHTLPGRHNLAQEDPSASLRWRRPPGGS
jgi:NADH-quinone oxidoreductase subunit F